MEKEYAKWVGGAMFLILGVVTKGYNQGGNLFEILYKRTISFFKIL